MFNKKIMSTLIISSLCSYALALNVQNTKQEASSSLASYIKHVALSSINKITHSKAINPTIIPIKNDQTIVLGLSSTDINRLFVKGDHLVNVTMPKGTGQVTKPENDNTGSRYIEVFSKQPFTAYAYTSKGRHFSFMIVPNSEPGQTVELKPLTPYIPYQSLHQASAKKQEKASSYEKSLVDVLKTSMVHDIPTGYVVANKKTLKKPIFHIQKYYLNHSIKAKLIEGLLGDHYVVRIIQLKNTTHHVIVIQEYNIFNRGVQAIALGEHALAPKHSTLAYEVVNNV